MAEIIRRLYPNEHYRRWPNISPLLLEELERKLSLTLVQDRCGDLVTTFGPQDVFNYIYAVLHSPTYCTRDLEFLKTDFPRVPIVSNQAVFRDLCTLGTKLVELHLMRSRELAGTEVGF